MAESSENFLPYVVKHRARRIRTNLHDDQVFRTAELDLLHTPAFQRLYDLHQLGLTDRVFVDASHSRFHHVVGVVAQVDLILDALVRNLGEYPRRKLQYGRGSNAPTITFTELAEHCRKKRGAVRLMGLLHDLTHSPYGHTLEDEIQLVDEKHDEPARQGEAFYRLLVQFLGGVYRERRAKLQLSIDERKQMARLDVFLSRPLLPVPGSGDDSYEIAFRDLLVRIGREVIKPFEDVGVSASLWSTHPAEMGEMLSDLAFACKALLHLDVAHKEKPKPKHIPRDRYTVTDVLNDVLKGSPYEVGENCGFLPNRDAFLLDVIGNTICADLLDYAQRDSFNAGLKLQYDPARIVDNFTLIQNTADFKDAGDDPHLAHPFKGACIRTAISVFSHKLRMDVPGELLNLLQARFYVYERMLYHPTKCIAGAMLGSAIQRVGWKNLPLHLRQVGDPVFVHEIRESAQLVLDLIERVDVAERDSFTVDDMYKEWTLQFIPIKSIAVVSTAMALIEDLRGPSESEVSSFLRNLRLLVIDGVDSSHLKNAVHSLLSQVISVSKAYKKDTGKEWRLSRSAMSGLIAAIDDAPPEVSAFVGEELSTLVPTLRERGHRIQEGLGLLSGVEARRYHRCIFRSLPDVQEDKSESIHAEKVSEIFIDPGKRLLAERTIEKRAGLPDGSVVIHCPKATGPQKLANIFIALERSPEVTREAVEDDTRLLAKLRDLGKISSRIFNEHQGAVTALEKMYRSTWRLIVGVAPSHDSDHARINAVISKVLGEMLHDGEPGTLDNDVQMVIELQVAEQSWRQQLPVPQQVMPGLIEAIEVIDPELASQLRVRERGDGASLEDEVRDMLRLGLERREKEKLDSGIRQNADALLDPPESRPKKEVTLPLDTGQQLLDIDLPLEEGESQGEASSEQAPT